MFRRLVLGVLSLLVVAGLTWAQSKQASGRVKALAADSITVTDDAGKDWTFVVNTDTTVAAKGASHKMKAAEGAGKPTAITDFVKEKQPVDIKYEEKDGKLIAKEVRVK